MLADDRRFLDQRQKTVLPMLSKHMSSCFMSVALVSTVRRTTHSILDGSVHSPGGYCTHNGFASYMRSMDFGKSSSSITSLSFVPK